MGFTRRIRESRASHGLNRWIKRSASVGSTEFGSALTKLVTKFGSRHGGAEAFGARSISSAPRSSLGRNKSVRGADREHIRQKFIRATNHRIERAVCDVPEEEQSSLELFRKTAAVVSKNDRLVDYQREERRNANGSPGKSNQRVCARKTPASIAISLCRRAVQL